MADRDMTSEILLQLQDNMTRQFEKAMKSVDERTEDSSKKFTGFFNKIKGGFDKIGSIASKVILPLRVVGGAIKEAYDFASDLVKEFEKVNNQMTVLKSQKVWGDIKPQMETIETATGGVVDQLDLLESVNKAVSFGIDLTNDRLIKLVGASQKAALTMGTDLKYAFDSLIVGTARESKMILDNLGVMVNVTDANELFAKSIGKTVDELSNEEQKAALLNQVLSELDKTQSQMHLSLMKTSGTGTIAKWERDWRNFKLAAGEALSMALNWFDELGLTEQQQATKRFNEGISEQLIKENEIIVNYFAALKRAGVEIDEYTKKRETAFLFQERVNDLLGKENELIEVSKWAAEELKKERISYFGDASKAFKEEEERKYTLAIIEGKYGADIRNRLAMEEGPMMEILERQIGMKNLMTKATLLNIKTVADAVASFEALHAGDMEDDVQVRAKMTNEAASMVNFLDELNANVGAISRKNRNRQAEDKYKGIEKDNKKEQDIAVLQWENLKNITESGLRAIKDEEMKAIENLGVGGVMSELAKTSMQDLIQNEITDSAILLEVRKQNFELQQTELEIQRAFELKQAQEHQERLNQVKQFGFDFAMNISSQMYSALINEQDLFTKAMIGNALKQVGGEVWADGWKNVMIGTGKLISTFGAVGGEQVAFGGVEIVAGAGMGYVGKTLTPPKAASDKSDAAKERNAESSMNQINVTLTGLSLYGGETEARKRIVELVEK